MNLAKQSQNERGAVLVISLVFMTILTLLGSTAVVLTTTDMQIGANYKTQAQAFSEADAGATYAIAMMSNGLKAGSFPPSGTTLEDMAIGATASLAGSDFDAPSGFSFDYEPIGAPVLTKIGENKFSFTTTTPDGSFNNSSVTIMATCRQKPAISLAAFGDKKLDGKSSGFVLSYDSASTDPTVNDPTDPSFVSTHEASVASNEWLVAHAGVYVDGTGILGENVAGSGATDAISDYNDFYGDDTPRPEERIEPDPLEVNLAGGEYNPATYESSNDNANPLLATGLVGDEIKTNSEATLRGKAGGANFYLTSIVVKNGNTLTIDTTNGDVRIFLTGPIDLKFGSQIVMIPPTYDATKFAIYSNSTANISIKNSSDFIGLLYAPYCANLDVGNGGDFYGSVWGSNVDIKNTGTLYYDAALADSGFLDDMELTAWRDFRN